MVERLRNSLERMPREDLDTHDRFRDYVGNMVTAIEGCFLTQRNPKAPKELVVRQNDRIQENWQELFRRLEVFRDLGFEAMVEITSENVGKLLAFKDQDPLTSGTFESLKAQYDSMTIKEDRRRTEQSKKETGR